MFPEIEYAGPDCCAQTVSKNYVGIDGVDSCVSYLRQYLLNFFGSV